MATSERIPSLDGFRAISIGLVLFGHLLGTSGFFLSLEANKHLALGELGVRVFFVISGFLITNLLLTEAATTGGSICAARSGSSRRTTSSSWRWSSASWRGGSSSPPATSSTHSPTRAT